MTDTDTVHALLNANLVPNKLLAQITADLAHEVEPVVTGAVVKIPTAHIVEDAGVAAG